MAATPQPNLVQLINKAGGVFHRVGVTRATPQGTAWIALNFNGLRMKSICCAGAIPREQMELPPLVKGSWLDEVRAKIAKRDFVERNKTMFGNYHTFNDVSLLVNKQKRGVLRWYRDGSWNVTKFELNGTTLTYSDEDGDDEVPDAIRRPEILQIEALKAIHGNCVDESTDGSVGPVFRAEFETRTFVLAAESQREKEGWMLSLLTAHAEIGMCQKHHAKVAVSRAFVPPSPDAIWALDADGLPWYCEKPSFDDKGSKLLIWYALKPYLRHESWGCALGRFISVTSADGLTWALGADHSAYVSNHHMLAGSKEERLKVVNSTISEGWTKVPPCASASGQPELLTSITMGIACIWATAKSGDVLIRWGIGRDCGVGERWERVSSGDNRISSVRVSANTVWAFTQKGVLVARRGCGTIDVILDHFLTLLTSSRPIRAVAHAPLSVRADQSADWRSQFDAMPRFPIPNYYLFN